MNTQCPCCGTNPIKLITTADRGSVIESHTPPSGAKHGNFRSGAYCDASGYTPAQAMRWSALSIDEKRARTRAIDLVHVEAR